MSWYYYLEDKLDFPFTAKCISTPAVSPLKKGETIEVLKMAPEDACMNDMIIVIRFADRKLACRPSRWRGSNSSQCCRGFFREPFCRCRSIRLWDVAVSGVE